MNKNTWVLGILLFCVGAPVAARESGLSVAPQESSPVSKGIDYLLNYLNMAGTTKRTPRLHLKERTHL